MDFFSILCDFSYDSRSEVPLTGAVRVDFSNFLYFIKLLDFCHTGFIISSYTEIVQDKES